MASAEFDRDRPKSAVLERTGLLQGNSRERPLRKARLYKRGPFSGGGSRPGGRALDGSHSSRPSEQLPDSAIS